MLTETSDRPVTMVLADIVKNIQDIVRSEVRLGITEVTERLARAKQAGVLIVLGACFGFIALFFALFAVVLALTTVMTEWAAALIVAAATAVTAGVLIGSGRKRLQL
jgi:hypothetical protein